MPDLSSLDEGRTGHYVNRFIPPDVIYMQIVGDLSEEDGHRLNREHAELGRDVDGIFFLCDLAQLESVTSSTRKEAVEIQKKLAIAGIVLLQAPLKARIFAKLIMTTANMFRREQVPFTIVETEEEGWAWIERRRAEYHASKNEAAAAGT